MKLETLIPLVALLATLSIAAERLVELVKGLIPWMNKEAADSPAKEGFRRAAVLVLAVNCGCTLTLIAAEAIGPKALGFKGTLDLRHYLICGLLVAGGAALWNSILGFVVKMREFKGAEAERIRANARVPVSTPPTTQTPPAPRPRLAKSTGTATRIKIPAARYGAAIPMASLASIGARSSARGISLILAQPDGQRK